MNKSDLNELIRSKVEEAGSQKAFAGACGVSTSFLSDVLAGKREPGQKLLSAMGLEKVIVVTYSPIRGRANASDIQPGKPKEIYHSAD